MFGSIVVIAAPTLAIVNFVVMILVFCTKARNKPIFYHVLTVFAFLAAGAYLCQAVLQTGPLLSLAPLHAFTWVGVGYIMHIVGRWRKDDEVGRSQTLEIK